MGYRSEIAIGVDPKIYKTAPKEVKQAFDEVFGAPDVNEVRRIVWYHEWLKWFESIAEVYLISDWLREQDTENYGLLRLGEEDEDIENRGSPYDFGINYVRKLEIE